MSSATSNPFIMAKRDYDHAVINAIKEAATRFYKQTGVVPLFTEFHAEFDCEDPHRLEYVISVSRMTFDDAGVY